MDMEMFVINSSAVCTGLQQGTKVHMRLSEDRVGFVQKGKVEQRNQSADGLAERRCGGSARRQDAKTAIKYASRDHYLWRLTMVIRSLSAGVRNNEAGIHSLQHVKKSEPAG